MWKDSFLRSKIDVKIPMHRNFDNFLLDNMIDRYKPKRKLFTVC